MDDIDPVTGLPKELGAWENIAKGSQTIEVVVEKKKFGKIYTVVQGIDPKEIDVEALLKKLKGTFACGGTLKQGRIELQGNHKTKMRDALVKAGFAPESIIIK